VVESNLIVHTLRNMTAVVDYIQKNKTTVLVGYNWMNKTVLVENKSVRGRYNSETSSSVANNFVVVENNQKNTKLVLVDYN
jgi:hypothetical protein